MHRYPYFVTKHAGLHDILQVQLYLSFEQHSRMHMHTQIIAARFVQPLAAK